LSRSFRSRTLDMPPRALAYGASTGRAQADVLCKCVYAECHATGRRFCNILPITKRNGRVWWVRSGVASTFISPRSRSQGIGTRSLAGISELEILFVVRHSLIALAPGAQESTEASCHRNPKQRKRRRGPAQMVFLYARQ